MGVGWDSKMAVKIVPRTTEYVNLVWLAIAQDQQEIDAGFDCGAMTISACTVSPNSCS